ncbi:Uncharacterized protein TCM_038082 [Theobroma cacao]|uniref:Uncharacterized protein n=1 Tax=Theobroma cacao TaxID=3641 RepID=A0A061GMG6_THECC|nr:Uncharacterized protein TCM_038082 [Theobroma cacao]
MTQSLTTNACQYIRLLLLSWLNQNHSITPKLKHIERVRETPCLYLTHHQLIIPVTSPTKLTQEVEKITMYYLDLLG